MTRLRPQPAAGPRLPAAGLLLLLALGCTTQPPPPVLLGVSPALVEDGLDTPVLLRGSHLEPRVTLDFDRPSRSAVDEGFRAFLRGPATVPLGRVTWLDAGLLSAVVPAGAPLGTYDVAVLDPWDAGAVLPGGLQVRASCPLTFLDLDGDGFGDPASGERSCAPGRVDAGADCNDQDPLTHPGAAEVCNGADDDCDGQVDEGACTLATPTWGLRADTGGSAQDWATAWSYAPGALWVAGGSQAWVRAGSGAFRSASSGCPSSLVSSWAAAGGWLQAGGGAPGAGRLATDTAELRDGGCFDPRTTTDQVVGVVGFTLADGGTQLRGAARKGSLLRWARGGGAPVELPGGLSGSARLEDLHGSGPDALFAAGGLTEDTDRMRVWR